MREFTRHEAAEVSGLHYQTLTNHVHRQIIGEPFGWSHVVALTVAHRLRESGGTIPIVRKAVAFLTAKSESAIRRLVDNGRKLLVASAGGADVYGCGDSFEADTAALVIDLAAAILHVDTVLANIESREVVTA
jgi:hypothetical protein